MPSDPTTPLPGGSSPAEAVPPPPPLAQPPVIAVPPPSPGRQLLASLLSLCLGLFLADAAISLVDDSLILFFDVHLLTGIRGVVFLFATLIAVAVYGLMGLTPLVPKRLFLPLTLFSPLAALLAIPLMIHFYSRLQQVSWLISLCQVVFGLVLLGWCRRGLAFRWPWVPASRLAGRGFGWLNLSAFVLVNLFVLAPLVVAYLFFCAALAVNHFSDGFVGLHADGLTVQVRKYVRSDGKTVQLFPMSHVGESDFYRRIVQSFPSNSLILMEGVTDRRNLITNEISYERMAASLGVAEQTKEFVPARGEWVAADVDVDQFGTNTIALLNLVMRVHSKRAGVEDVLQLLHYSPPPHFEEQLLEDLLTKRNRHLLAELNARLSTSELIIVPWGAAHMPGIARGIQDAGFTLAETQEYVAVRFHSGKGEKPGRAKVRD